MPELHHFYARHKTLAYDDKHSQHRENKQEVKQGTSSDKACIVMKKVPYSVIQKGKKVTKKLHTDFEHFRLICLCYKKGKKYFNNFTKRFWLLFLFLREPF